MWSVAGVDEGALLRGRLRPGLDRARTGDVDHRKGEGFAHDGHEHGAGVRVERGAVDELLPGGVADEGLGRDEYGGRR